MQPVEMVPRRPEALVVAAFIAILVATSSLPYYISWRRTPPDRIYTGASGNRGSDLAPYLARMRAGARGEWTYRSPYAPGIGPTLTIRPSFTIMGALTGFAGAPFWVGYHAARLLLGVVCLVALFGLAGAVSRSRLERWVVFILSSVGSGIGWMIGRGGQEDRWSYDLWVGEMNVAHSLITSPHFLLSILLMLACVAGFARSLDRGRAGPAAWGGAAFAFLALDHPYDDVVLAATLVACGIAALVKAQIPRRTLLKSALTFALVALPAAAWEIVSVLTDPSLAHMGLNQPVGSVWSLVTGLGFLPILAVPGGVELARRSTLGRALVAWCLVVPVLFLLPTTFPRRLVAGWQVPLGIAAGIGLARLLTPIRKRALRGLAAIAVLTLASLSTVDVYAYKIRSALEEPELGNRTWLPRDYVEAYAWLQSHGAPRSVVLAPFSFSNFVPVYSDLCPYFGHWAETPDAPARSARALEFYQPDTTDARRSQLLAETGADWVIAPEPGATPGDRDLDLRRVEGLSLAGRAGALEIFRARPAQTPHPGD